MQANISLCIHMACAWATGYLQESPDMHIKKRSCRIKPDIKSKTGTWPRLRKLDMHKQPDTCRKVGRAEYDKHADNMSNTNTENTKWRTFNGDPGHKHRHIYVFMYTQY